MRDFLLFSFSKEEKPYMAFLPDMKKKKVQN